MQFTPQFVLKILMFLIFIPAFVNYSKYIKAKFNYFDSIFDCFKSVSMLKKLDKTGEDVEKINLLNQRVIIYFVILILLQIISMNAFD